MLINALFFLSLLFLNGSINDHSLDGQVFFNTVFGSFAAKARFLDTTKWQSLLRNQASVDTNHTSLESFGNTVRSANILGKEIRSKTNKNIVSLSNDIFLTAELDNGHKRTKGLFVVNKHVLGDIRNNSSGEEVGSETRKRLTTSQDFTVLSNYVFNVRLDLLTAASLMRGPRLTSGLKPAPGL